MEIFDDTLLDLNFGFIDRESVEPASEPDDPEVKIPLSKWNGVCLTLDDLKLAVIAQNEKIDRLLADVDKLNLARPSSGPTLSLGR